MANPRLLTTAGIILIHVALALLAVALATDGDNTVISLCAKACAVLAVVVSARAVLIRSDPKRRSQP